VTRARVWPLALGLLLGATRANCDETVKLDPATACPGALVWTNSHPEVSQRAMELRDQGRVFKDPALRKELKRRLDADQRAQKALGESPRNPFVTRDFALLTLDNVQWLKQRVRSIPTVAQVGESGVHWALLLVSHMPLDSALQSWVLPMFAARHAQGELSAQDLASLIDRRNRARQGSHW
jgi:hypothetical protein